MLLLPVARGTARRPYLFIFLFAALILFAQIAAAQDNTDSSNDNNDSNSDTTDDSSDDTSSTSTTTTTTDNYPVITPPPTEGAPYMQKSSAPEGTVFIAVGAVLGAMGLSVLAWRGLVAWSVNRSVRRAALTHSSENKGLLRGKKKRSGRSRSHGHGHTHHNAVSLEKISGSRHSTYRDQRGSKIPTSGSGLFFSPTAGMNNSGNRGSNYLPAGYYAAGSAAASVAQNVGLSAEHLPPQARGYTRTGSGPTPPATPLSPPTGMHEAQQYSNSNLRQSYTAAASTSSLNLTSPPQGRTPSAYLEDLFENHPPGSPNRHP